MMQAARKDPACYLFHAGSLPGLLFNSEDGGGTSFKMLAFTRLHGVISQKMELFKTKVFIYLLGTVFI
jgi:hypothetical protein